MAEEVKKYMEHSPLKNSHFFYEIILNSNHRHSKKGFKKPVVGYFCNLIPEEIIYAAGCLPVRLCSQNDTYAKIGEEFFPADMCPVIKSACGAISTRHYENIDFVIVPAACDGKTKLAEMLVPFKEIYFLDLPKDSDYLKSAGIWTGEYAKFLGFIKNRYDRRITRKDLIDACTLTNRRTNIFREIYEFRALHPGIINAFDYFTMTSTSFISDAGFWSEHSEKLYDEAKKLSSHNHSDFKGKRILLSGSSIIFPNYKVLDVLDELGCDIGGDTQCSAYGRLYDPVEIDEETEEGILRALSLKYVAASMCPCFLGIDKFIDRILDLIETYKFDGVIYNNLRLCQVFEIQGSLLKHVLREKEIPFLFIKTDLGKEDTGQLKTRIEAFLEILK